MATTQPRKEKVNCDDCNKRHEELNEWRREIEKGYAERDKEQALFNQRVTICLEALKPIPDKLEEISNSIKPVLHDYRDKLESKKDIRKKISGNIVDLVFKIVISIGLVVLSVFCVIQ